MASSGNQEAWPVEIMEEMVEIKASAEEVFRFRQDGRVEVFKESVEMDEANKTITLTALGGHPLERYASFKVTFQVIPAGEEGEDVGGFVKITQEYGKKVDESSGNYIVLTVNMIRDIDAHLVNK